MEEEKSRIMPEALHYKGFSVVTTKQLTELFHCTRQNIDSFFRRNKDKFTEGVDYFRLEGAELRELKADFARQRKLSTARQLNLSTCQAEQKKLLTSRQAEQKKLLTSNLEEIPPFSGFVSVLYVWTKDGTFKLSEYVGTDRAKMVYAGLSMTYFDIHEPATPKQTQLFEPQNEKTDNLSDAEKIKLHYQYLDKIIKLAEMATDNALRDELIQRANVLIQRFTCDFK